MFQGEYKSNRRWNGQGYVEMDKHFFQLKEGKGFSKIGSNISKLQFEDEYLNRERNRKVKEYYYDDKLKFEGIYLNGQKNGKGKKRLI